MAIEFNETLVEQALKKRIRFSVILIACIFVFIFLRLVYLQILKGNKYSQLSTNNRIRVTKTPDPRGFILSKNDRVLVKNIPSFDLTLIPQDAPDTDRVLHNLSDLLNIDKNSLRKTIEKNGNRSPFEPITLIKEISWEEMSLILSKRLDMQGINIAVVPKRFYCFGDMASHVFGFLGEINPDELQKKEFMRYSMGDLVGKYGLEKWGEKYLRGAKGGLQTEVDVYGNRQQVLARIDPVPGCNLVISIKPKLQKLAEELLKEKTGAVVAMNPWDGEIFVLASSPGFDSNLFSRGICYEDWNRLVDNPLHPLLNRTIQSQQPPGSLFKIVTAISALEEKRVDPTTKFHCPGYFNLGRRRFNCWKKGGHGWMDMKEAIIESCDVYFYNLALQVGLDNIIKYARLLGFGAKTGIALEGEKSGLLPTPRWKKKMYGVDWQLGETLNISIGQGYLLTTPMQIATIFSGIATGGRVPQPKLVLHVDCERTKKYFPSVNLKQYKLSHNTLSFLKAALTGVVNDPNGTGFRAKTDQVLVAGKTGTAQIASKKLRMHELKDLPRHLADHAWFVAFAPVDNPRLVVSVLIEHGGGGGMVAAPIAKKIIQLFFNHY